MDKHVLYLLVLISLSFTTTSCFEKKLENATDDVEEICRMLVLEAQETSWDQCQTYINSVVIPFMQRQIDDLLAEIERLNQAHDRDAVLGAEGCITDGNGYWSCAGTELCPQ